MSVIIVLILASLSVAVLFMILFLWAIKGEQFEDTFTPSVRILNDDKN